MQLTLVKHIYSNDRIPVTNDIRLKGQRILRNIKAKAWQQFDDNNLTGALRWLERYNFVNMRIYHNEKEINPGEFLNDYLQQRVFESRR